MAISVFRHRLSSLIERIKSGEVAGAKFTFNEAAAGYIQSRMDDLAKTSNQKEREVLAVEIKGVATALGSLHPFSLANIILASEGNHCWVADAYTNKKTYFDQIEDAGLAKTKLTTGSDGRLEARLEFTAKGKEFLRNIGISNKN